MHRRNIGVSGELQPCGGTFVPGTAAFTGHSRGMTDNITKDRVVVGVDGSRPSVAALRYAARIATAFQAPLEAVTIWSPPAFTDPYLVVEWTPEQDAEQVLDAAIADAFGDSPPERLTRTVLPGPAARTLIGLSRHCDTLVLGSRGHGGFVGMLLGSVSSACAAHAHCPVLIVRSGADD